mgnify:CR=1 FL=1
MVEGAWQEQDEARGKWLRARISSTQLSTYFVGSLEMWDLDVEVRRPTLDDVFLDLTGSPTQPATDPSTDDLEVPA